MREQVLRAHIEKSDTNAIEKDWKATQSTDYLVYAKQHKYNTFKFNDPQFTLRQKSALISTMSSYIQQLMQYTDKEKYAKVALAVNEIISPQKNTMGDKNPWYDLKQNMDASVSGLFNRTLRLRERELLSIAFTTCQKQLMDCVNNPLYGAALRDLTSLDGINGWVGFSLGYNVIRSLSQDIAKLDLYNKAPSSHHDESKFFALNMMQDDSTHPWHQILFLPAGAIDKSKKYEQADNAHNDGSGLATPELLSGIADEIPQLDKEQPEHPALAAISNSVTQSEIFDFTNFRRVTTLAGAMLGELFETLVSLQDGIATGKVTILQFSQAFTTSLSLAKILDPQTLGEITIKTFDGDRQVGKIIGFQYLDKSKGLSTGDAAATIRSGEVYDNNGTLIISSSKNQSGMSNAKKITAIELAMVPEDSTLAKPLNNAVTNKAVNYPRVAQTYQKLRVPYFLTLIEIINLINASRSSNFKDDPIYSFTNIISAIVDLSTVATETYLFMVKSQSVIRQKAEKVAAEYSFTIFGRHFSGVITVLRAVSIVGGLLTAALAGWDALRAWDKNDKDAAIGAGIFAAGTAIATIAGNLSSAFLGGPIGWLAIAIALAGGLGYLWLKDTPMQEWLANGPFAKEERFKGEYASLADPEWALVTWVNFIIGIKVTVYPKGKVKGQLQLSKDILQRVKTIPKTHYIHISTNLPIALNENNINLKVAQVVKELRISSHTGATSTQFTRSKALSPMGIVSLGNSYLYCINAPTQVTKNNSTVWGLTTLFEDIILAKVRVTYQGTDFPLLSLKKANIEKNNLMPAPVDFRNHQDEWADNL